MKQSALTTLFLTALLTLQGCLLQAETANCDWSLSCATCIQRPGCGWCVTPGTNQGQCVAGTSLGDTAGICRTGWRFSTCTAPPGDCSGYTTCDRCTDLSNPMRCEWCAASSTCLPRGAGPCATFARATDSTSCRNLPCLNLTTCSQCVGSSLSCYWCTGNNRCTFDPLSCTPSGAFTSYSCPAPPTCAQHSSCAACANTVGCGWCSDPVYLGCSNGTSTGSTSRYCPSASWTTDYLTCP